MVNTKVASRTATGVTQPQLPEWINQTRRIDGGDTTEASPSELSESQLGAPSPVGGGGNINAGSLEHIRMSERDLTHPEKRSVAFASNTEGNSREPTKDTVTTNFPGDPGAGGTTPAPRSRPASRSRSHGTSRAISPTLGERSPH